MPEVKRRQQAWEVLFREEVSGIANGWTVREDYGKVRLTVRPRPTRKNYRRWFRSVAGLPSTAETHCSTRDKSARSELAMTLQAIPKGEAGSERVGHGRRCGCCPQVFQPFPIPP